MVKSYEPGTPRISESYHIDIVENGPYLVFGHPPIRKETIIVDDEGSSWDYSLADHDYVQPTEPTTLCRCGHTKNAPYCDGSHLKIKDWDPTLTAPRRPPLAEAQKLHGPGITLTDSVRYCAFARFCDAKGRTWNQVDASGDPAQRDTAIRTGTMCPAGRLKLWDIETGEPHEMKSEPAVGLLEDPAIGCSGPIFIRGGIPITAPDGYIYEVRNRVTLCRCGQSCNKPFCDGTHASMKFQDHLK